LHIRKDLESDTPQTEWFIMILQVQGAAGLSSKEVAEETAPRRTVSDLPVATNLEAVEEAAREKRAEFAQETSEKLINLEVRVPLAIEASSIGDSALDPFLVRGNFPFARELDTIPQRPYRQFSINTSSLERSSF
jgi:hypothetical protein